MNDQPTSQSDKQARVNEGVRLFKGIEDGFDSLAELCQHGHDAGMMPVNECHELQNIAIALKYQTLAFHCRMTAVAQRNACDVPSAAPKKSGGGATPFGGPGR